MIDFTCSCGKKLNVPDSLAYKKVTCNQCGRRDIQLPGPGERLDLNDYELEDMEAGGTITLEPPVSNNLRPRKPVANQRRGTGRQAAPKQPTPQSAPPPKAPAKPAAAAPQPTARSGSLKDRQATRDSRAERRPTKAREVEEPQEVEEEINEEVNETASRRPRDRKGRSTSLQRRSVEKEEIEEPQETDEEEVNEEADKESKRSLARERRGTSRQKKTTVDEAEENLKETADNIPAHRRERNADKAKRPDRSNNAKGKAPAQGKRERRGRSNDLEDLRSYKKNQMMIYGAIGLILVAFVVAYFILNRDSKPKTTATPTAATPTSNEPNNTPSAMATATQTTPEKPANLTPGYEKITEIGAVLITKFNIKDDTKESLEAALEEKRQEAIKRKMNSKAYDNYVREILEKKLTYVLAIENILDSAVIEDEEQRKTLFALEGLINASSNINTDAELMQGFPLNTSATTASWDQEKLKEFLNKAKETINKNYKEAQEFNAKADFKNILEIIKYGKIEDDIIDNPLSPN